MHASSLIISCLVIRYHILFLSLTAWHFGCELADKPFLAGGCSLTRYAFSFLDVWRNSPHTCLKFPPAGDPNFTSTLLPALISLLTLWVFLSVCLRRSPRGLYFFFLTSLPPPCENVVFSKCQLLWINNDKTDGESLRGSFVSVSRCSCAETLQWDGRTED